MSNCVGGFTGLFNLGAQLCIRHWLYIFFRSSFSSSSSEHFVLIHPTFVTHRCYRSADPLGAGGCPDDPKTLRTTPFPCGLPMRVDPRAQSWSVQSGPYPHCIYNHRTYSQRPSDLLQIIAQCRPLLGKQYSSQVQQVLMKETTLLPVMFSLQAPRAL